MAALQQKPTHINFSGVIFSQSGCYKKFMCPALFSKLLAKKFMRINFFGTVFAKSGSDKFPKMDQTIFQNWNGTERNGSDKGTVARTGHEAQAF